MESGILMNVSGAPLNVYSSNDVLTELERVNAILKKLNSEGYSMDDEDVKAYSTYRGWLWDHLRLNEPA
jgi:cytochrome c